MKTEEDMDHPAQELNSFRLDLVPPGVNRASPRAAPKPRTRRSRLFIKGPIDWPWIAAASRLPGKALHVALVLHFLAGMKCTTSVALSGRRLEELGVARHSAYRALRQLENAGLVMVVRKRGRQPRVNIQDPKQIVGSTLAE